MMFSSSSGVADFAEYSLARLLRSASEPLIAPYDKGLEVSKMSLFLISESSRS